MNKKIKHIKDLREYIECLKKLNEIQEINEPVNWNLEMGAIIRRSAELKTRAPLFNNIKDYENSGFRVLGAPGSLSGQKDLRNSRVALSFGLDPSLSMDQIIKILAEAYDKEPIKPKIVDTAPCKENILLGNNVDLFKIPTPLIHEGDGGRYINTLGTIVAQTPDGSWTNWSIARIMINDKNSMVGLVINYQHIGMVHNEWKKINKDMPFALALGTEPVLMYSSSLSLPAYVNEADFIGGYLGEPIDVVKCETNNLYAPASAEIIIEGHLSITETAWEGPMGEYTGYIPLNHKAKWPKYNVEAITHRDNAILPVCAAGAPTEETQIMWGLGESTEIYNLLKKNDIPVTMCFTPFDVSVMWMVITLDKSYREKYETDSIGKVIGDLIFDSKGTSGVTRVMIMDDDIDPQDTIKVSWAYATRCHPVNDVLVYENKSIAPLAPYLSTKEKQEAKTSKHLYNCLLKGLTDQEPTEAVVTFDTAWPSNIKNKVIENWNKYGY